MTIKIAFATDDGKRFNNRHFGDATYYDIYIISESKAEFVRRIINNTEDENDDSHADLKKAHGIVHLLIKENIKVVVSKVFGPNIKRIRKKFVCVLVNVGSISEGIQKIQQNLSDIAVEWEKGENRNHLNLKELSDHESMKTY
jgi:predicted Fe-Mo cluster-binding NifX family protein